MLRPPSPAFVVACLALFVALGGPAAAARLITSKDVKAGSLQASDLSKKARRTLTGTPDGSITEPKLATNAVSTRTLAPGSVLTGSVEDGTLTAADLAANSVGTEEVGDNAVGQTEIRNNGVGASEIADQSIDGGEIIDGALVARDLARFSGSFAVDFGAVAPRACQPVDVTGTASDTSDTDISNDLVLVSAAAAWPAELVYDVKGTPGAPDRFTLFACNPGSAPVDPPESVFRYAVVGY